MIETDVIKQLAAAAGFHACGVAQARDNPRGAAVLAAWLTGGCHADMHYMARHQPLRSDPRLLLPGCKTVVSLLLGYKPDSTLPGPHRIATYAYGRDYHRVMKQKLWQLLQTLAERYPALQGRPFVDTAPLFEKYWAVQAGLGHIGKNTLLQHPRLGSWVNIGTLLLCDDADRYDNPLPASDTPLPAAESSLLAPACHACTRCVDACPNQALAPHQVQDRQVWLLDARRCTSYHTIENRAEQLPDGLQLAGYLYGCDCCQQACPANASAPAMQTLPPERREALQALPTADEATFKQTVRHSAMSRIKYPQWQRNVSTKMQAVQEKKCAITK